MNIAQFALFLFFQPLLPNLDFLCSALHSLTPSEELQHSRSNL